jgi:class 3 adenylate cyclase
MSGFGGGRRAQGLHSAVWVDGTLAGGDIPAELRHKLIEMLASSGAPKRDGELAMPDARYRFQRFVLNEGSSYPTAELVSVFSLAQFDAQQRALVLRIVLTGAVVFGLAALIAIAFSRQLAQPIAELVAATKRIRSGDYTLSLGRASTREMNTLAESFDEMAAGLALKDRYYSLLKQVTDQEVADELVAGRVKLGGELRDITVMFCDIRGYTPMTVGRSPEEVIAILNHHTSAMARIIQAHRGVINQFAGDAIMILFGAPRSYGDDAARAVECACAMMRERERMNREAPVPLDIGIGIASGLMVAGCIGAENRSDYTAVGERANLAARLCASAAAGQILLDAETYERVRGSYPCRQLPPLTLKGFAQPVSAYGVDVGGMPN